MAGAVAWEVFALVGGVVLLGGLVKGTAGFGYAVASTALLATVLDPSLAVVVVILPMLAANLALVGDLGRDGLQRCLRRFWPYVGAALVGTLVGMAGLDRVPGAHLALGLGVITGGYVLTAQPYVAVPGLAWLQERCFRRGSAAKVVLGLGSGVVFGASNVAVQVVAYLDSLELDRSTFAGVLSMILVGVSTVRVGAAWYLGLYRGGAFAISAVAIVPGLAGVAVGRQLRQRLPARHVRMAALALLAVIAIRLIAAGLSGL